jgi:hypothetical protein
MADPIDPSPYLRPPIRDLPSAIALGIALLAAHPRGLPPPVRKSARNLRNRVIELQQQWAEHRAALHDETSDPRPADLRLDRAWGALCCVLEAFASLGETIPESVKAAKLHARLFPEGYAFVVPFGKQWAESERRLRVIEKAELEAELEQLVGDFVFTELHDAHAEYGEVLGITSAERPTYVNQALRELQQAVTGYALQLLAAAHTNPELVPIVRDALEPIHDARQAQARRIVGNTTPAPLDSQRVITPTTPVPFLDDLATN